MTEFDETGLAAGDHDSSLSSSFFYWFKEVDMEHYLVFLQFLENGLGRTEGDIKVR